MNIAVCDDNIIFLNEFVVELKKIVGENHHISMFKNAEELLKNIEDFSGENIDVVITDVELTEMNGINMAKKIKEKRPSVQIIIITNYTEYIEDAFSVDPIHYILKPIDFSKVKNALEKAAESLEKIKKNTLTISSKNKFIRVNCDDVKYVESYMRTILVHEIKCNTEIYMKLDEFDLIAPSYFIRTHKSYLVNMNMIKSISNNRIELFSGEIIPVAKVKYPDVKKQVLKYLGEVI